jgi:hypothetical protein
MSSWIDPNGLLIEGEKTTRTFALTGDLLTVWPKLETVHP